MGEVDYCGHQREPLSRAGHIDDIVDQFSGPLCANTFSPYRIGILVSFHRPACITDAISIFSASKSCAAPRDRNVPKSSATNQRVCVNTPDKSQPRRFERLPYEPLSSSGRAFRSAQTPATLAARRWPMTFHSALAARLERMIQLEAAALVCSRLRAALVIKYRKLIAATIWIRHANA
jgi:hypothetical protein